MNFSDIKNFDLVNGEGVGVSLFVSGCNINCPGCFNKKAQNFNFGYPFTKDTLDTIIRMGSDSRIDHLSILGGEPLDPANVPTVTTLVKEWKLVHPDKPIWLWTGYTIDNLFERERLGLDMGLFGYISYLVEGPYLRDKPTTKPFRGSDNQRLYKQVASGYLENFHLRIRDKNFIIVS